MNASSADSASIRRLVDSFPDPESGRGLGVMDQVLDVQVNDGRVHVKIGLTSFAAPIREEVVSSLRERIQSEAPGMSTVEIEVVPHRRPAMPLGELGLRAKAVIAVGSGKGGVGKSTIAASIACGLQRKGCAVGLMDADVYGPSIPHLLGLEGRPEISDEKKIRPHITASGLKVMSMGFLIPPDQAVVWRGPMLHGAITQFLRDTDWGELDYLIIDMPPGTGDIALTLSQLLPLTGAIVVCTPQDVALLDANKAIAMFEKVRIPLLGMIENMSGFECSQCGARHDIFGSGGARARAEVLGIPFLGTVPIQLSVRTRGDAGEMAELLADEVESRPLDQICVNLARGIYQSRTLKPALPTLPVL